MDFKENKPIYMQIVDKICSEIVTGKFPVNERIPSVREYGASLEVNANTVVRSYDFLQNKDIIFNKRGIGYFVSADAKERIQEAQRKIFLEEELPLILRKMELLGIDPAVLNQK